MPYNKVFNYKRHKVTQLLKAVSFSEQAVVCPCFSASRGVVKPARGHGQSNTEKNFSLGLEIERSPTVLLNWDEGTSGREGGFSSFCSAPVSHL